jgi:1-acyl-sn-glycerol-3-phosphate acyltransferase
MYEIMRLSGQEYVDMYASRAKEESKRLEKEAAESSAAAEQKKAS